MHNGGWQIDEMGESPQRWSTSRTPILLMLAFFLSILPFSWNYVKHHPDERHYTDAAAIMVETGDFVTPFTPEGDLRLKKPILTYWLVAVGYKLFGVSSLTSRFPFLVLGTLIVGLTYRLCKELADSRKIAIFAACIVAIQPSLIISSMRSIPDVVLTFCLLLSAIGFARMLNRSKPDWRSIAAAYGGLGLAVEAKGLPGLVFGVLAMISLVMFRAQALRSFWRRHLIGMTIFLSVALGWFIAMYGLHRHELLEQFFGDQVGDRVNWSLPGVLLNFGFVFGLTVTSCLPWLGALLDGIFCRMRRMSLGEGPIVRRNDVIERKYPLKLLLVAWIAVYLVLASSIEGPNMRYLCSIAPFLACLVACQFSQLSENRMGLWLKRANHLTAFSLILTGLLLCCACHLFGGNSVLSWSALVAVLALSVCALRYTPRPAHSHGHLIFAVTGQIAFIPLAYIAFQSFACSHFEKQLVDQYLQQSTNPMTLVVLTNPAHASRIRVASGGAFTVEYRGWTAAPSNANKSSPLFDAILLEPNNANDLSLHRYRTQQLRDGYTGLEPGSFFSAMVAGRVHEYLKDHEQNLLLAIRLPSMSNPYPSVHTTDVPPSPLQHASYHRLISEANEAASEIYR